MGCQGCMLWKNYTGDLGFLAQLDWSWANWELPLNVNDLWVRCKLTLVQTNDKQCNPIDKPLNKLLFNDFDGE